MIKEFSRKAALQWNFLWGGIQCDNGVRQQRINELSALHYVRTVGPVRAVAF